jgi:hypothetical protein
MGYGCYERDSLRSRTSFVNTLAFLYEHWRFLQDMWRCWYWRVDKDDGCHTLSEQRFRTRDSRVADAIKHGYGGNIRADCGGRADRTQCIAWVRAGGDLGLSRRSVLTLAIRERPGLKPFCTALDHASTKEVNRSALRLDRLPCMLRQNQRPLRS